MATSRRRLLKAIGTTGALISVAGCSGGQTGEDGTTTTETTTTAAETTTEQTTESSSGPVTVAVGPEKKLRFEPEDIEVSAGTKVVWEFESPGHNVTSLPGASPKCQNPDGAEPFASYDGKNHFSINEVGTTFEHTFEVPGKYVYVCAPHAGQGMVGSVTVTE